MPNRDPENGSSVASVPEEITGAPRRVVLGHLHWSNTFVALRHPNFRLFISGQLISLTGTWMQNTAQGWLVYQLTNSKLMLGLVAAAGSLPLLLFSVWGGSLADRYPKRRIVLCTQATMMLAALAASVLIWTDKVHVWHIAGLAALAGLAMAFDMPARQAFMMEMTSREDLMNAISLNSSIVNGARVVGPSVAGLLMASVGVGMCFFLNGISYVAVIAGLWLMRLPKFTAPAPHSSTWDHMAEGFHYAWGNRRIRIMLILFAIVGTFGWSYSVLMPAFARDVLGVGQGKYGMLLSANGVGALLGALTVASAGQQANRRLLVLGGLWVFSGMLLLLALSQHYVLAMIYLAVAGWGMLLFFSTINTLLQTSASDHMRGRVMGIWALIFGGMTPVGGLLAGTLSHYFGVRWAVSFGALVCGLTGWVVWLVLRKNPSPAVAPEKP
jgi:MFS family permease